MIRLTKFQFTSAILAILFLRLIIGFHFIKEGKNKLDYGNFTAEPFFASAKGPLAPYYKRLIEDSDHEHLFCFDRETGEIDPKLTLFVWEDYRNQLINAHGWADPSRERQLIEQRKNDFAKIQKLREEIAQESRPEPDQDPESVEPDKSNEDKDNVVPDRVAQTDLDEKTAQHVSIKAQTVEPSEPESQPKSDPKSDTEPDSKPATDEEASQAELAAEKESDTPPQPISAKQQELNALIASYETAEEDILKIRSQRKKANDVFEEHKQMLTEYLDVYGEDIKIYFLGLDRLKGFAKDNENRTRVANEVPTLRGQVDSIKSDLKKESAPWVANLTSTWDSYERKMNALLDPQEVKLVKPELFRIHGKGPILKSINKYVPWFDLTIGILLFIGLFTRLAAIAAACFLFGICTTQIPWAPGAAPTYYQWVEMAGLLVLAGTSAGRIAGLDFFIHALFSGADDADDLLEGDYSMDAPPARQRPQTNPMIVPNMDLDIEIEET